MANFMQMLQKAQAFKGRMRELQERVRQAEVSGAVGGVTCRMSGRFELKDIAIDPSLLKPEGAKALQGLILAAVGDAYVQAEKLMAEETRKLMDELGLPPGMELPF